MGIPRTASPARPDAGAVLTKAFLRAGDLLGLSQRTLAKIIGRSEASMSRIAQGRLFEAKTKEGEHAALFVRLYRSLDSLLGGNSDQCRLWLTAENSHVGGRPIELIQTTQGLVRVVEYLDAMRGKA
jgi:hypothetical protein